MVTLLKDIWSQFRFLLSIIFCLTSWFKLWLCSVSWCFYWSRQFHYLYVCTIVVYYIRIAVDFNSRRWFTGADPGDAAGARSPLKLEKIWFFCAKSWFFPRNTTKIFAPPSARRNFFYVRHPKFKSWIRPWFMLRNLLFSV